MYYLRIWMIAAILISVYGIFDLALNISGPAGLYDGGWFYHQSNHMGGYLMVSLAYSKVSRGIFLYLRF